MLIKRQMFRTANFPLSGEFDQVNSEARAVSLNWNNLAEKIN